VDERPPGGNKPSSSAETMRAVGELGTIGMAFVLAIAIGFGAGYMLDRWLGTHWISLIGFVLGFAAAIVNVVRTAKKFIK
jgi:F0F1-type ATP synthase assembly protein I